MSKDSIILYDYPITDAGLFCAEVCPLGDKAWKEMSCGGEVTQHRFVGFNNYINSPIAIYLNELNNLLFNMSMFSELWGIRTPNGSTSENPRASGKLVRYRSEKSGETGVVSVVSSIFRKMVCRAWHE